MRGGYGNFNELADRSLAKTDQNPSKMLWSHHITGTSRVGAIETMMLGPT
jgi:hypothetical protein